MVGRFRARGGFSLKGIESSIELEHIDARFTEKAEQRLFHALVDKPSNGRPIKAADIGHPVDLEKSRFGADMGVEPRSGGRHQVGRNGLARRGSGKPCDIARHAIGEQF